MLFAPVVIGPINYLGFFLFLFFFSHSKILLPVFLPAAQLGLLELQFEESKINQPRA